MRGHFSGNQGDVPGFVPDRVIGQLVMRCDPFRRTSTADMQAL
jgi:hypothetical protein